MSILTEFVAHPRWTGAVAASSAAFALAMTEKMELQRARTVVELGPGTGPITQAILSRLPSDGRLITVEINRRLAANLTRRYRDCPVDVVHGSAADLADFVDGPVDAVISGLPWPVMPELVQRRAWDAIGAVLSPGGRFATFAYLHAAWTPPARRLRKRLVATFGSVEQSPVVWRNAPPAFVHRATMPLPASERTARRGARPATALRDDEQAGGARW